MRGIACVSVLVLGIVPGCFQYRDGWERALRQRAAFEFQCPEGEIKITPLTEKTFGSTNAPINQGVTGCGKRGVYTATVSGYVSDSGSVQAATPPQH